MEPVIAQALFESLSLLTNACESLRLRCVDGITANPEVCLSYVMNSIGLVTFLNPIIGHHNGDRVGKECARTGKNVREVVLELGLLSAEALDEIFAPENLMRPQYRGKVYAAEVVPGEPVLAGSR
jgi:aspartate ammonia-lyase